MDIFLSAVLVWDDPPNVALDNETRTKVLHNITAALQWAGFSVGFFSLDEPIAHTKSSLTVAGRT